MFRDIRGKLTEIQRNQSNLTNQSIKIDKYHPKTASKNTTI